MKLLFDEDLVESAVLLCVGGKWPGIPPAQIRRFHAERECVYRVADPDARNAAFYRVHLEWFREWGLEDILASATPHFPQLAAALDSLALRKARNKAEEGAELYVNPEGARTGIVTLRPERFMPSNAPVHPLLPYLHHELSHVSDMVDPSFGYTPEIRDVALNGSPQRLLRERYRILWDGTIDGRLMQRGLATVASREFRQSEFTRAFSFFSAEQLHATFEQLWSNSAPRHDELMALAMDPRGLRAIHRSVPGATCPVCGFSSFSWADADALEERVRDLILGQSPDWTPEQGVCARCVEVLQAVASTSVPATVCL
ncbi:MAG: hypothetical protein AB1705_06315 [Verrucomicrobiota bacterium]